MAMTADARRICVVIGRTRHKMVAAEIREAGSSRRRAHRVAPRLHRPGPGPETDAGRQAVPIRRNHSPAARRRPLGASEDARQMMLKQCIVSGGFEWVDLETDIADKIRRFKDVKRIVSYHNLAEFPSDLEEIYARMSQQDADIVKIVVAAQSPTDNLRMIDLMKKAAKPTIAFCSGDLGFPSRILCLKYRAPFTYAAFNRERGVVPGMPSFEEMLKVYHPERINADTRVYGVVGDPVGHSHSPLVQNAAFRERNVDAIYVPFRVTRGHLPPFLEAFGAIPVEGYSVTIPHKEAAAQAGQTKDEAVELTRAANTLIRKPNGFFAANTDYPAIMDA